MSTDTDTKEEEGLKLSLARKALSVELLDPTTNEPLMYSLKELIGSARDSYLNFVGSRIKTDATGKSKSMDFTNYNAMLLSMTLYGPDGKLVDIKTIQSWPATAVLTLFEASQKLSGLDKDAEKEAKKD